LDVLKAQRSTPIEVKTGISDSADCATTRIPITKFLRHIVEPVSELPMLGASFSRELPQPYNLAFFREYHTANLAVHGNLR
jgi:hypothetical protein